MLIYEVPKKFIREYGSLEKAIEEGYYIPIDDNAVKMHHNPPHGTIKDLHRWMENNKGFCVWYDVEKDKIINT